MNLQGEWHWRFIEEDHSGGKLDKGLENTGDSLMAPAILLKECDSRLPLMVDYDQILIARLLSPQ